MNKKCQPTTASCKPGTDHICSDGYCYSGTACPLGTYAVTNGTCKCSSACSGSVSSLQVRILNLNKKKFSMKREYCHIFSEHY